MSDEATERLTILLQAKDKDLARVIDRSNRLMAKFAKDAEGNVSRASRGIDSNLAKMGSKISGIGAAFVGGLAGGIVTGAFAGLSTNIAGTVRGIAEIGDAAKRAGLGLTEFQEWKFVAEQNRIGIDQMVDGLKELSLRADEFVTTGGGPAAESFARLGYSGAELAVKLKDPSALLKEIIGRMGELDRAAQLRVADEVFGGSAGERFTELVAQGAQGLTATMGLAHELGAVMDREMIDKAVELDRRWNELSTRVGSAAKAGILGIVELADAGIDAINDLHQAMADRETVQVERALGPDVAGNAAVLEDQAVEVDRIKTLYRDLERQAAATGEAFAATPYLLANLGYDDVSAEMVALTDEMRALVAGFGDGTVDAEAFAAGLGDIQDRARQALSTLDVVDRVDFMNVSSELDHLGATLSAVRNVAVQMVAAVKAAATLSVPSTVDALGAGQDADKAEAVADRRAAAASAAAATAKREFLALQDAENAKSAKQLELDRAIASFRERAAKAGVTLTDAEAQAGGAAAVAASEARAPRGGSGAGKADKPGAYTDQVNDTEQKIAAWNAEAAALVAVAAAGKDYGSAVDYARKRAELLQAAQQQGLAITPELTAEIDALAQSYASAGESAEEAAGKLDQMQANAERGADALSDIFTSVLTGAKSGREAVADLLAEIAKIQMQKALAGIFGGGGGGSSWLGALGGLLGGARAGGGGVSAGVPYLVNENTPDSEIFVPSSSGAILNVPQAQAALRGAAGGGVSRLALTVTLDDDGRLAGIAKDAGAQAALPVAVQVVRANNQQQAQRQKRQ